MRTTLLLSLGAATAVIVLAAGWGAGNPWSQAGGEMARNGGFEEGGSPIPQRWMRDLAYTGKKGTVSLDRSRSHSGRASLKLQPNSQNSGDFPLAIAQVIPAAAYRGKTVEYSGFVQAEGGATAELGMLSFVRGRGASLITVDQPSGGSHWTRISRAYEVPDDRSVQLVVTCIVRGQTGTAWFDDVSVVPASEQRAGSGGAPANRRSGFFPPPCVEVGSQRRRGGENPGGNRRANQAPAKAVNTASIHSQTRPTLPHSKRTMNQRFRSPRGLLLLLAGWAFSTGAEARYAFPEIEDLPTSRLIANLEKRLASQTEESDQYRVGEEIKIWARNRRALDGTYTVETNGCIQLPEVDQRLAPRIEPRAREGCLPGRARHW